MKGLWIVLLFVLMLPVQAMGAELAPPPVPESGEALMPKAQTLSEGLRQILGDLIPLLRPDLAEAAGVSLRVIAAVLLTALLSSFREGMKPLACLVGTVSISLALLGASKTMITLGADTVEELTEYGKLLLPVMTAGLAAQGRIGTSTAMYAATAAAGSVLGRLIARVFLPMLYLYLALSIATGALGEEMLKRMKEMMKKTMSWCLKTLLTLYTSYMGITGAVSGTTDAALLKTTKATIAAFVPVVGGILSDASEVVLVGMGLAKNAAGIYGILAVLAVFLGPFLRIATHYLLLKGTAAVCGIFAQKPLTELIGDFSSAMGLLLGMTGAVCILLLIGTVCFLRGVG